MSISQRMDRTDPDIEKSIKQGGSSKATFVSKKKSEWSAAKESSSGYTKQTGGSPNGDSSKFRVVHPYGFKILKNTSAVERSLHGYFRLPPPPNPQVQEERERLHRELLKMEKAEMTAMRDLGGYEGLTLDGFLLLNSSGCDNPEDVESVTLQKMNLTDSVRDDLAFFPNLFFLDVSENKLRLEDLLNLSGLETLHLAYNQIDSLRGVEESVLCQQEMDHLNMTGDGTDPENNRGRRTNELSTTMTSKSSATHDVLLPRLTALNMSCNLIPHGDIPLLSYFPCLEKLDLSSNFLKQLPHDLSFLSSVTHFALENNQFSSRDESKDVFISLSTMPSLVEVNLNHNNLSHIYPFSVDEGSGVCFPSIEVIGLSGNQFKTLGDFLPLARLHRTLRRVVLSKNPIGRDNREVVKAKSGFDKVILDAYFERTKQQGKGDDNDALWNKTEDLWNAETWERFLPNQEEGPNGNQQSVSTAAAKAAAASYAPAETSDRPQAPDVTTAESSARVFTERPQRTETGATMSAEEYLHSYHVDLIFTDVEMPKKSTREFYSSGRSAQQPLVTVPNYKEFMDIYRITGSTKEARNAPLKKTTRPQKQGVRVAVRTAATPTEEPSDEELEEYDEEVEVEVTDSDAEEEDGGDFFITGVDDETDTRKKKIIRTTVKMKRPKRSTLDTTESFDAGDATMATTTSNGPTAHNAVSELRNLLRKPLPHLPYSNTN